MMSRDLRATDLYREVAQFCADVRQPGAGRISDASQMHLSPDKRLIAFAATVAERVDEESPTRLAIMDLATGVTRIVTEGPGSDRLPRFSADGQSMAFLSDRHQPGDFQLHLLDLESGTARPAARVRGRVEQLQWSADNGRILLRVVGPAISAPRDGQDEPSWLPLLEPTDRHDEWRSCWLYELATDTVRQLVLAEGAVWEASWCGTDALATIASDLPGEDAWYSGRLCLLDLVAGQHRTLYQPQDQLGPPMASPDGATIAVVEGLCSDRGPVIGELRLIDIASGKCRAVDLRDVDVVHGEWRSDRLLLLSGYRGLTSVIGVYDIVAGTFRELWSSDSRSITAGCVAGLAEPSDCVVIVEGFRTAPEIATIRDGRYKTIRSLDIGYAAATSALAAAQPLTWSSTDGLGIQGWLLRPAGSPPYPVIADIHGGPVSHWRPGFMIRRQLHVPMLLRRGYAIFLPNPRGSSGRGQAFTRRVMGDLGGREAADIVSGLDDLVEQGIADPRRLGVTGVSYGGFMTAWLVTQSDRFAAAVSVSPHTNQVTAHLLSNIPGFMSRMVGDDIADPGGRYFERSPIFHATNARTPTLSIAGALDRCTPAAEAVQFHNILREAGVESALAIYPHEGHGVRRLPAAIDCTTRVVGWLTEHMATGHADACSRIGT